MDSYFSSSQGDEEGSSGSESGSLSWAEPQKSFRLPPLASCGPPAPASPFRRPVFRRLDFSKLALSSELDEPHLVCTPGVDDKVAERCAVCTPLATDRRALVIVKPDCDCAIDAAFWRCVRLLTAQGISVFIEPPAMRRLRLLEQELGVDPFMVVLQTWDAPVGSCGGVPQRAPPPTGMAFEVAISIGGDGTLLWLSHLFGDAPMPPVLPVALGTLGFLTPFSVKEMDVTLGAYLTSPSALPIALRSRLVCRIHRAGGVIVVGDEPQIVLNELLVERGSDGGRLAALDIFVDGVLLTRLVGDGLIIATPCGSTGYSLAAGGALAHPSANVILLTPKCAHSLSFRPLLLPDAVSLRLEVAAPAFASFDGRGRTALRRGDVVTVTRSEHPLPSVCARDPAGDWAAALQQTMHFNRRGREVS